MASGKFPKGYKLKNMPLEKFPKGYKLKNKPLEKFLKEINVKTLQHLST